MTITIDKLLLRLQTELSHATETDNYNKKREHLAAIKSLCELALDANGSSREPNIVTYSQAPAQSTGHPTKQLAPSNLPSTPIKQDDANGDSLFDF